jgi:hypothetical protein
MMSMYNHFESDDFYRLTANQADYQYEMSST